MAFVRRTEFCAVVNRLQAEIDAGGGGTTYTNGDGLQLVADEFSVDSSVARKTLTLSQFAATTSAELLALLTNPTGTGLAVFATGPTITGMIATADKLAMTANAYVQVTASRDLTDADNGKILWSNSASAFTLNNPGGLTTPFNCSVAQLGTGIISFTSGALFNIDTHTKTGGQGAVVSLMIRPSGTTLYLYGRTQA